MESYAYVINVDGAVVRDDEYLLIKRGAEETHASGVLGFPGGKVEVSPDVDEPIERTAARELAEEVGDVEYVLSRSFEADDGTQCLNIVTLCEYVGGEARPRETDEVAAVYWLSIEEIRNHEDVPAYVERDVERIEEFRGGGESVSRDES